MADVGGAPRLKFLDTALYALAIGTGLRWVAVAAADGPGSLTLWIVALFTFYVPLAAATADLSGRFTVEGGIYTWARDALGPLAGFLCGWFYWISLMPFFAGVLYFLSALILQTFGADPKDATLSLSVSLAISLLVTGVQLGGLKYGKWLPNFGTAVLWIVLIVILAMAAIILSRGQTATDFVQASYVPSLTFDTAILWGTIMFAYSGVEALGFLRNEIEGGIRTIVYALVIVGIGSLIIYAAGTAAFLVVLPRTALTRLSGFPDALSYGLVHVGMAHWVVPVMTLFVLATLGSFTAWFGVGARLPFVAGLDHFLPARFGWRHPRTGAPVPAILLQGAMMLLMVFVSQTGTSVAAAYDFLVAMSVLTVAIPYVLMLLAYLKCARLPVPEGGWSPWGGAATRLLLGWMGVISTLIAIGCSLIPSSDDRHPLAAFLKIVISAFAMAMVGLAFYWLANRRRSALAGLTAEQP